MTHIGLTGGIGSGKSTVAKMFAELGAATLDADALSRELTGPGTEGAAEIGAALGPDVLAPDGSVDRKALARKIFADEDGRHRVEAILHPRIVARRRILLEAIRSERGDGAVVVSEAALIFEAGTRGEFDRVVLVTAPLEVRRARLAAAGWPPEAVEARMCAQWPDEKKARLADFIVSNGGDLEETRDQVRRIWEQIAGLSPSRAPSPPL